MLKFEKNDRLDALIVLVRDEQFSFPFENDAKGGPLDDFFYFLAALNNKIKQLNLVYSYLFNIFLFPCIY